MQLNRFAGGGADRRCAPLRPGSDRSAPGRREIAACRTTHQAHVAVEGQQLRAAVGTQQGGDLRQSGLRREVGPHLGLDQDRGAHIDRVEHFDDVLPLAKGISGHGGGIECASSCHWLIGAGRSSGSCWAGTRRWMRPA